MSKRHQKPATISQVTKCVKRNMHNVKINLNPDPDFEQSTEFVVLRKQKKVTIETSLSSKSVNEDKNTLVYKENEVLDIPRKLNEYFDSNLDTQYYIYGVPSNDSFFYSLLYVISKDFKLKDTKIRSQYVSKLKESLSTQASGLFRKNKYSKYGYKCADIVSNLETTDNISEGLMALVSDYFGINLVVLNYDTEKYWIGKEYNTDLNEKNVIIIYSNGLYLPLIHIFGEMPSNFIYKCIVNRFTIYNKLANNTDVSLIEEHLGKSIGGSESESNSNTDANIDMMANIPQPGQPALNNVEQIESPNESPIQASPSITLKGFTSYKLNELQTLATQHNIDIKLVVNGKEKNKTKRVLYDELVALS